MSVQLLIFLDIIFSIAILAAITYWIVRPIILTQRAIEYYNFLTKLMIYASLKRDGQAIAAIQKSLESGLSPVLLAPLRWLERTRPETSPG